MPKADFLYTRHRQTVVMTMTNVENTNLDIFMIGVESSDQQQSRMPPAVTDQKEALPSKNLEWTEQHSVHRQQ